MKDLCRLAGLSRQAIHFYIQQGLLPEGKKTGRNMAYYSDEHVERLLLIRKLQRERLLPLKAIKAVLDAETASFDDGQRAMLAEVRARLLGTREEAGAPATIDAATIAERLGLRSDEVERMAEIGLLALLPDDGGGARIPTQSVWILELWSQMRALGFSEELGFSVADLAIYEEAMSKLFQRETELVMQRLSGQPPARVADMVERSLPLVDAFLVNYHAAQVRNFLAAME